MTTGTYAQPVAARTGLSGEPTSRLGLGLAMALLLGCAAGAFVGGASLVQVGFPTVAVLGAAWLLVTGRSAAYVEFVLWLWLLGPGLRRVVDLAVGWTPVSLVMTAAPGATLLCLVPALLGRRRVDPVMGMALVVGMAATAYGLGVGVLKLGVGSPLAAGLTWLPPLALGLYVATAGPERTSALLAVVRRTALLGCLVLGAYGVFQFIAPPPWDRFWLVNAPITSAGYPEPYEVRVFATLNAPAPFASVLGVLLVLLTGVRAKSRGLAMAVAFVAFGLSLVRTAWLGYLLALMAMVLPGRTRLLRASAVGIGLPVLLAVLYGGPLRDVIRSRFVSTTASGTEDQSFSDRSSFYRTQLPQVLGDPVGDGLGSTGAATKVANAGELSETGNFDGGALEVLYVFGLPVGAAFLLSLLLAVYAAWRTASRRGDLEKAMAAALVGLAAQLLLFNPITTPSGIFFWLLIGVLARPSDEASLKHPPPRDMTRSRTGRHSTSP